MICASRLSTAFISFAVLAGSYATAKAADFIVIDARRVALRVGQTVDSTKPLTLKEGQQITLISPTGATIKLDGPYDKAPDAEQ
ncbi:MAG TPA: hypothetical protein VHT51_00945, partial [Micropepsaceae bacterium]|nr:hypothetical protein [Micropepsaceae bacterium]